jgi:hypothetical protein
MRTTTSYLIINVTIAPDSTVSFDIGTIPAKNHPIPIKAHIKLSQFIKRLVRSLTPKNR